ncbi:MAG: glycosyltransferase, partial [Dehalococcoidia bacterium]|nr:glycosyltransferase [Dehalococcoidia bacterium]
AALERLFLNEHAPTQRRLLAISERLLRARVVTAVYWQAVARRMSNGEPLDVALGVVTGLSPEQVAQSLARAFNLPYQTLTPRQEIELVIEPDGTLGERRRWHDPVDPVVARLIGRDTAQQVGALPIRMEGDTLVVACADPSNTALQEALANGFGTSVRWVVVARPSLEAAIQRALGRKNLGTQLLEAGLITEADLNRALDYQRRVGARLGAALITLGIIRPEAVADFLARQLNLLHVDLATMPIYSSVARQIPEEMAREYGVIPIAVDDTSITIAMVDPLDDRAVAAVHEYTGKTVERVVATESAVFAALQDVYRQEYLQISAMDLMVRKPEDSASRVLSRGQKWFFIGLIVVSVIALFVNAVAFFIVVNTLATAFYFAFSAFKFYIIYRALGHKLDIDVTPEEVAALDERALPMYTILIPLYKEASVAQQLIRAVDKLDYPKAKLDVKLLIEEDDPETLDGIIKGYMPSHFKIVIIPHGKPKGKPKACNYGLIQALGEYVVIYDAEDRPEPDQLKKVVVAFQKSAPDLACIQCKLNYFNRNQNILTRWFTIEYSMWFDLLLPGLDAIKAPIPLGGTSNHFRTDVLRHVGAWDPWNVTEDADLGTRLYKLGLKTAVVDSTTYEEANSQLWNWIRQRSRWVKGYIQTWLVHMRNPVKLWRDLGPKGFLAFQLVVGGTFFGFLLNPLYWALTALWIVTRWDFIQAIFPTVVFYMGAFALYFGNFAFAYINVAGCIRRQYYSLVPYAVISPIYWALMSVAAWKGFLQLFTNPFYWEKTIHGLDGGHDDLAERESPTTA